MHRYIQFSATSPYHGWELEGRRGTVDAGIVGGGGAAGRGHVQVKLGKWACINLYSSSDQLLGIGHMLCSPALIEIVCVGHVDFEVTY